MVAGKVLMFDLAKADAASTDFVSGSDNSIFTNVLTPTTAGINHGWFCVLTESIADDADGMAVVRGVVSAFIDGSDAAALADLLSSKNASANLNSDAPGVGVEFKVIGKPLQTTAAGTAEKVLVLFNGIEGFGSTVG